MNRQERLYDYGDPARVALGQSESRPQDALFDAVIVDEAQDLRPVDIELVAKLAGRRS